MASDKQKELFDRLAAERQFPDGTPDTDALKAQFANLDQKSASAWIEKALTLPEVGETPVPF
jgi:hypothetical protein